MPIRVPKKTRRLVLAATALWCSAPLAARAADALRVDYVAYRQAKCEEEKVVEPENERPNQGGLVSVYFTNVSDEPIRLHCSIEKPQIVIVMDPTLLESPAAAVNAGTDENTVFLVNTSETPASIKERLGVPGATVHTVDATKIALDSFGRPIPNMPMIGALLAVRELMTIDELKESMTERFKTKFSQKVIEGNITAVQRAHEEVVSE